MHPQSSRAPAGRGTGVNHEEICGSSAKYRRAPSASLAGGAPVRFALVAVTGAPHASASARAIRHANRKRAAPRGARRRSPTPARRTPATTAPARTRQPRAPELSARYSTCRLDAATSGDATAASFQLEQIVHGRIRRRVDGEPDKVSVGNATNISGAQLFDRGAAAPGRQSADDTRMTCTACLAFKGCGAPRSRRSRPARWHPERHQARMLCAPKRSIPPRPGSPQARSYARREVSERHAGPTRARFARRRVNRRVVAMPTPKSAESGRDKHLRRRPEAKYHRTKRRRSHRRHDDSRRWPFLQRLSR